MTQVIKQTSWFMKPFEEACIKSLSIVPGPIVPTFLKGSNYVGLILDRMLIDW